MFEEVVVEAALKRLKRRIPYGWDLNIYGGCAHACRYCYAQRAAGQVGSTAPITVKTNVAEVLERELSSPSWQREVINLGGTTDSYQPAEAEYRLMPEILKVMIKHRNPVIISTKSDLVLRDYDLIAELSRLTYVNIAVTVTTTDAELAGRLEPGARPPAARLGVVKAFGGTRASRGLHVMPIIPRLADTEAGLEELMRQGRESGVDYVLTGTLYLTGGARRGFFRLLEADFPELVPEFRALYPRGGAPGSYKQGLYQTVGRLRQLYGLSSDYMTPMRARLR